MNYLVTDDCADGAIAHRILLIDLEEGRLEESLREN